MDTDGATQPRKAPRTVGARLRGAAPFLVGLVAALAFGWIAFPALLYESIAQPLSFSHATHIGDDVGMTCDECHPFDDDGRLQGAPSLASCAECHEEAQGESEAERRFVEEYVAEGREVPWLVYARQPDNAWFPHAPHVRGAGLDCERCHGDHGRSDGLRPLERNRLTGYSRDIWGSALGRLGFGPQRGAKMSDCEGCHAASGVETGCQDCHR